VQEQVNAVDKIAFAMSANEVAISEKNKIRVTQCKPNMLPERGSERAKGHLPELRKVLFILRDFDIPFVFGDCHGIQMTPAVVLQFHSSQSRADEVRRRHGGQ